METDGSMATNTTETPFEALQRIGIPSPCPVPWSSMAGDDRERRCGHCHKSVFNLSAMPQSEAAALLAENAGRPICVLFFRRADGTMITSDGSDGSTSPPAAAKRTLGRAPLVAAPALLVIPAAGCPPQPAPKEKADAVAPFPGEMADADHKPVDPVLVMGELAAPAPEAEKPPVKK